MVHIFKKSDVRLPHIAEVRLLTMNENEYYGANIAHAVSPYITDFFWLGDKSDEENMVNIGGSEGTYGDPAYPDEDDDYEIEEFFFHGIGNRPVLVFEKSEVLNTGDKIQIGNYSFTMISSELALSDSYISCDLFDDETNEYAKSAIRDRIKSWYEREIQPIVGQTKLPLF